jgi:signal peptidase I
MKETNKKGAALKSPVQKSAALKDATPVAETRTISRAGRRPLVPALVWLGLDLLAVPLSGCPRFNASYLVFVLFTLALTASELFFLDALYRKGKTRLFLAWKKFTGYALVVAYVVQALPRVAWHNEGLIGEGRTIFLFALELVSLISGCVAFFLAGRAPVLAAFGLISEEELADPSLRRKNRSKHEKKGFLAGLLEWVDAIAFAAIAVILIDIFVFQLYVIPSESMVPNFLIGDRPFTDKLTMGPRVPLTDWRLPAMNLPKRGDIVTIANPRYPENHQVNVRKQFSQFLYMITFTAVNIDRLPDGTPKSDPLVKRVVGLPGEKLMMVDDVLYSKRAGSDWAPVADDKKWACVDAWKLPASFLSKVQTLPVDERSRELLDAWSARKNGSDPEALGAACAASASRIEALVRRGRGGAVPVPGSNLAALRDEAVRGVATQGAAYLASLGPEGEDVSLALAALRSPEVVAALSEYAADAVSSSALPAANPYEAGSRAVNLLVKQNLLARVERDLSLLASSPSFDLLAKDEARTRLLKEAQELDVYLVEYYDCGNFPEFPSGSAYLAQDEYFAMGDNRYNSLDFRYSEQRVMRALDSGDKSSVEYRSLLKPFALKQEFIEGRALFILWPFSRLGAIGN